jgi:ankyrin repeat protein
MKIIYFLLLLIVYSASMPTLHAQVVDSTAGTTVTVDESFDYLEATEETPKAKKPKFSIIEWFKKTFAKKKKPKETDEEANKLKSEFANKDIEELNYLFIQAAIVGDIDNLVQLIMYGVNINTTNYQGRTALIEVARLGDAKTAEWLLDRGASLNHKDMYDGNALLYATQRGKREIVNLLIERGARREMDQ